MNSKNSVRRGRVLFLIIIKGGGVIMKRFWRVWISSFDLFTPTTEKEMCMNCCQTMQAFCKTCINNGHLVPHRQRAKYVFTLLHVLQKQKGSVFFGIDKNVLEKIIRYALKPEPEKTTCSIVKLECKHMFHRHCYERWIMMGNYCVRCGNSNIKVPVSIKSRVRVPYYIHIEICTEKQMRADVKKRKIMH